MTVYGRIFLAGLGSLAILLGALGFQYLGELAPCPLCIWQRWPHLAAALLALLAMTLFWRQHRMLAGLGALVMVVSAGLGAYHAGVEWGIFDGPGGCTAARNVAEMDPDELLRQIEATDPVRCDEVAWSFLGLSMAGWNAVISAGLAGLWGWSARPAQA